MIQELIEAMWVVDGWLKGSRMLRAAIIFGMLIVSMWWFYPHVQVATFDFIVMLLIIAGIDVLWFDL